MNENARPNLRGALQTEVAEQIFACVFRELKPRTALPRIQVEFCPFANANSFIRLESACLRARLSDLLQQAPASVIEALAHILISKLYRKSVGRSYADRYRRYLNGKDVRHALERLRQARGRKLLSPPQGSTYDLEAIFEDLNLRYFHGLMARPALGWSPQAARLTLGHYDPAHHTIVLSKLLDSPAVPKVVVDYVMFHEMLHLRYPEDHRSARRCVHTPEFKAAEKQFEHYREARQLLKKL